MAKSMLPMSTGGGGLLSKLIGVTVAAVVLILVFRDPVAAGHTIRAAVEAVLTLVSSLADRS